MSPLEIFSQLSHLIVNLYLKSPPFVSILSYLYMCGSGSVFRIRIRIHKAPEYGSGSGSTTQCEIDQSNQTNRITTSVN